MMVRLANSLRLMQINVQSIRTLGRVEELQQLLKRHDVHVAALHEVWLSSDTDVPVVDGYH